MKQLLASLLIILFAGFAACSPAPDSVKITVTNPSGIIRENETVEIPWDKLSGRVDPKHAIVISTKGEQVPSQVIFEGGTEPVALIFQASVGSNGVNYYIIKSGDREEYTPQAYGRYVPERMDDYAWENNIVAFRAYGPALEKETITHGIDVWVKRTEDLIIDKWYSEDLEGVSSYHKDTGEGCDCYKVGRTLGCGGSAPYVNGKLVYGPRNYATQETLDNGPVRTTVRLTYSGYDAEGVNVRFDKVISLDAHTHFNKITDTYYGSFDTLPVGAGVVKHKDCVTAAGKNFVALMEPASDSQAGTDGDIACAVIAPDMKYFVENDDNIFSVITAKQGLPFTYLSGAGWSKNGVAGLDQWLGIINAENLKLENPLIISYN